MESEILDKNANYVRLSVRYIRELTNYSIRRAFAAVGYVPDKVIWEGKKVLIKFNDSEEISEKAVKRAIKVFGVPKKVQRSSLQKNLIFAQVG